MKKLWLLALLVPLVCMGQEPDDESVINCKNLIRFGSGELDGREQIFGLKPSEWDSNLLNQLRGKSSACTSEAASKYLYKNQESYKIYQDIESKLRNAEKKYNGIAQSNTTRLKQEREQARYQSEQAEKQKQREINEQKQKSAELLKNCRATKEYDSYDTQEALINAIESHQYTADAIKQQRKFERESGVRNLYEVRKLGEDSVQEKERIAELWAYYKKNGGKASNPAAVKHTLANPCKELDDAPH